MKASFSCWTEPPNILRYISRVRRKITNIYTYTPPQIFNTGLEVCVYLFVCFWGGGILFLTISKSRRYLIRKTLKLMEIKLIYSKGYSNSIYMIFNIPTCQRSNTFFTKPLCGWMKWKCKWPNINSMYLNPISQTMNELMAYFFLFL